MFYSLSHLSSLYLQFIDEENEIQRTPVTVTDEEGIRCSAGLSPSTDFIIPMQSCGRIPEQDNI